MPAVLSLNRRTACWSKIPHSQSATRSARWSAKAMVTSLASWVRRGRPKSGYRQEAMISIVAVITTLLNCAVSPSRAIESLAIGHESGSRSTLLNQLFFLLYAAWVRSRAERPSVSYTKVVMEVAWTGHNCNLQRRINQQNCGSNKFLHRGGREDETDARAEHQTHWRGASNEWMMESGFRCSAGHQTHWQDASKGGVQIRACVDLRGRLGARK